MYVAALWRHSLPEYTAFCCELLRSVAKPRKLERSVWDLVSSGGFDCEGERGLQHVQGGRTLQGRCRREQTLLVSPLLALLTYWYLKNNILSGEQAATMETTSQHNFFQHSVAGHRATCVHSEQHFWGWIWSWKWTNLCAKNGLPAVLLTRATVRWIQMELMGLLFHFLQRTLYLDAGAGGRAGLVRALHLRLCRSLSLDTSDTFSLCRAAGVAAASFLEEECTISHWKNDSFLFNKEIKNNAWRRLSIENVKRIYQKGRTINNTFTV